MEAVKLKAWNWKEQGQGKSVILEKAGPIRICKMRDDKFASDFCQMQLLAIIYICSCKTLAAAILSPSVTFC